MSENRQLGQAPAQQSTDKSLMERISDVIEDVMKAKLDAFEKKIDDKIDAILKAKEVEVEAALRKSFGLEQDPTVKMSEMISYVRKALLENADTGKRTPAPAGPQSAGPEGASDLTPLEKAVKEFEEGGAAK